MQSVTDGGTNDGYFAVAEDYTYDANGNMNSDPSKGTTIKYNYLNLPKEVSFGANDNLRYTYDATGSKLAKVVDGINAENNTRVDYSGNFLYENNDLKAIFTSAGRIVPFNNNGEVLYKFEYNLQDHLGNSRVVFSGHSNGMPEVMQVTDYYPFGLVMNQENYFADGVLSNKYLYNGKELQDDELAGNSLGWYDYGARFYDAELARFHSIDPISENYYFQSPYAYAVNNPLRYIDWLGMGPGDPFKSKVEAANDFGITYNGSSIVRNIEFGSAIFKNENGTYSYTIAYIGSEQNTYINENIPEGTNREGAIHSHGGVDPKYDSENFSPGDKRAAEAERQNEYIVTPSGKLLEYDVSTKNQSEADGASKDIPSDPKAGESRATSVDAKETYPVYIDPETGKTHNGK